MTGVAARTNALRLPKVMRLLRHSPPRRAAARAARPVVLTTAETAECTCPEFCERDHDAE